MSFVFDIFNLIFQVSDDSLIATFLILELCDSLSLKSFLRVFQMLYLIIELFDDVL